MHSKLKVAMIGIITAVAFALPATASFAASAPHSQGLLSPGPLMARVYNAPNIGATLQMSLAPSTTVQIVEQLNGVTDETRNAIGILVGISVAALGVIYGSVMAVTWLPRLVKRFFPRSA